MTRVFCDSCNDEIEDPKRAVRVIQYGTIGITAIPGYKAQRVTAADKHFCSGECMIRNYDWLDGIPAKKHAAMKAQQTAAEAK